MRTITTHRSGVEGDPNEAFDIFATESGGSVVYSFQRSPELPNDVRFMPITLNSLYFPQAEPDGKLVVGATVEALLAIALDRLKGFHDGELPCYGHDTALDHLETALFWLMKETADRIARGMEGKPEA